jgi:Protein of unknown function (DUF3108)
MSSLTGQRSHASRAALLAALAALLTALPSFLPGALGARGEQTPAREQAASKTAAHQSSKQAPMPFRAGEKLDYNVSWSSFTAAASVELSIPESRNLYGWETWHFRAVAHTLSPVRALFPVDDEFDSYTDAATLESRIYETYLNELGRKDDEVWQFVAEGQTPRAPGPAVIVLPGTRDPLGALYELRGIDWGNESQASARVYDGRHLYEMRAAKEASGEAVEVPAGKFSATRIGIQVFEQNKQVSGVHFAVWLANDAARTPVLMRAEMPFGTLRIEMTAPASVN